MLVTSFLFIWNFNFSNTFQSPIMVFWNTNKNTNFETPDNETPKNGVSCVHISFCLNRVRTPLFQLFSSLCFDLCQVCPHSSSVRILQSTSCLLSNRTFLGNWSKTVTFLDVFTCDRSFLHASEIELLVSLCLVSRDPVLQSLLVHSCYVAIEGCAPIL